MDLWGRLSNPVLRRLSPTQIDQLVSLYSQGATTDALAGKYGLHRTTVMTYLERSGVARRGHARKMTDDAVAVAARRYELGRSLAAVASGFGIHQRTLARELRAAGVTIRARNGWPASDPIAAHGQQQ